MIVALAQLPVFIATLLYFLLVVFVDDRKVQVCITSGTLADDANDMEVRITIIHPIGLRDTISALYA